MLEEFSSHYFPFIEVRLAPDADFAICVGVIILQVLHLALPHGRVSPSASSSRLSGLSLARTRRSNRLGSSLGHGRSFCKDLAQSARGLNDGPYVLVKNTQFGVYPFRCKFMCIVYIVYMGTVGLIVKISFIRFADCVDSEDKLYTFCTLCLRVLFTFHIYLNTISYQVAASQIT